MLQHRDTLLARRLPAAPPTMPRRSARGGFSMIETVMVVSIIGVGLGMALPRVQRLSNYSRVSNAQSVVAGIAIESVNSGPAVCIR